MPIYTCYDLSLEEITNIGTSLESIVSDVYPISWKEYLNHDDRYIIAQFGNTKLYGDKHCCNCFYITQANLVWQNFGYHGLNLFNYLSGLRIPHSIKHDDIQNYVNETYKGVL